MPRVIPDLNAKIINAAGVLFVAGRSDWIQRFRDEYQRQVGLSADPRVRLENLLIQFMEGLEAWGGLWEEFLASATREPKPEEMRDILAALRSESRSLIIQPLDALLRKVCGQYSRLQPLLAAPGMRFATSLLSTIKMMIHLYPDQKSANADIAKLKS